MPDGPITEGRPRLERRALAVGQPAPARQEESARPPHEAALAPGLAEELRPAGRVHRVLGVLKHMEFVVEEPGEIRTTRSRNGPTSSGPGGSWKAKHAPW